MSSKLRTPQVVATGNPPRRPHDAGGLGGGKPVTVADHVDALYAIWQEAIEEAGGTVWLASSMERSHPGVSRRVRHVFDDKKELQKTTLDMVGHICVDDPDDHERKNERARAVFLAGLAGQWGYEPPRKKRRKKTPEELAAASKQELLKLGDVGRQAIERIGFEDA